MANLQLIGELPRALRRASELVSLDLSGNRWGRLPRQRCRASAARGGSGCFFKPVRLLMLPPRPSWPRRRITGAIPAGWIDNTVFTKLKTLNLANNQLSGALPQFNRRGGFRVLEVLDLSNNLFHGERARMRASLPPLCAALAAAAAAASMACFSPLPTTHNLPPPGPPPQAAFPTPG